MFLTSPATQLGKLLAKVVTTILLLTSHLYIDSGEVTTLAGSSAGFADGNGPAAKFYNPKGICFGAASQSLFVCDYSNANIRRVKLNGVLHLGLKE